MTAITDAANATFRDSVIDGLPASGAHEPVKREIRAVLALIDIALASLGINGAITVKKATRGQLFADLAYPADTLAVVYNDPNTALNGIYAKNGASGAGTWTLTGLALPSSFATSLTAVLAATEEAETNAVAAAESAASASRILDDIEAILLAGDAPSIAGRALKNGSNLSTQDIIDFNVVLNRHEAKRTFVVMSTGQSNFGNREPVDWTPAPNFLMLNFWAQIDPSTTTGRSFAPPPTNRRGVPQAFCDRLARAHPNWTVYLLDFSRGGLPISEWGPSPTSYNMRQAIDNLALAALNSIAPGTKVDMMMWWQGESNASAGTPMSDYMAAYNGFQTWLETKPWWRPATPQLVFGVAPYVATSFKQYSGVLRGVVSDKPSLRKFVDTTALPQSLWNPSDSVPYIHMTAEGYRQMGEYAYDVWESREVLSAAWGLYVPVGEHVANIASSSIAQARWTRIGDIVRVSGRVTITPSVASGATTQLALSLPFASNLVELTEDLSGQATTVYSQVAALMPDVANDRALLQFPAPAATPLFFSYSFEYRIR